MQVFVARREERAIGGRIRAVSGGRFGLKGGCLKGGFWSGDVL